MIWVPAVKFLGLGLMLGAITSTLPWLNALRILGMAFLLTAITVALTLVVHTLQFQETALHTFTQARARHG